MKKILLALCIILLVAPVAAYNFSLSCPSTVSRGSPINCSVYSSDLPPGTSFNVVLYEELNGLTEISSQLCAILPNQEIQNILFGTTGLPGGQYKVDVEFQGNEGSMLQSGSITAQPVTVVDRSSDVTITSPINQDLADALQIEGSIVNEGNAGVQIEVRSKDNSTIFGPTWIGTTTDPRNTNGDFTQLVPVNSPGEYNAYFTDSQGFIGMVTFNVNAPVTPTTVPTMPEVTFPVITTTARPITIPTPWPTSTQSPLSPLTVIGATAIVGLLSIQALKKN
jgi:hypothetical protein